MTFKAKTVCRLCTVLFVIIFISYFASTFIAPVCSIVSYFDVSMMLALSYLR